MHEEGLDTGDRFTLLRLVRLLMPVPTWLYVAVVVAAFAIYLWRALGRPVELKSEARIAATLAAMALAFGTPHYAWYGLWLIALVTVAPRPAWFYLASASALLYYMPHGYRARIAFEASQFALLATLLASELVARRRVTACLPAKP
jgi:hypothetical protein